MTEISWKTAMKNEVMKQWFNTEAAHFRLFVVNEP